MLKTPYRLARKLSVIAVASCYSAVGFAFPTGPVVMHGQAGISMQGNVLNVVNTPGTVIHWNGFSIAANEIARFQQQSASSAVLNRVIGQDPSAILGQLQSNGRVFLINPNGILFGAGARVDVSGLVASTLNISDQDFLQGRMRFTGDGAQGAVIHRDDPIADGEARGDLDRAGAAVARACGRAGLPGGAARREPRADHDAFR